MLAALSPLVTCFPVPFRLDFSLRTRTGVLLPHHSWYREACEAVRSR